jgi:hypothetical protein
VRRRTSGVGIGMRQICIAEQPHAIAVLCVAM